jgi:hypothetical protein
MVLWLNGFIVKWVRQSNNVTIKQYNNIAIQQ